MEAFPLSSGGEREGEGNIGYQKIKGPFENGLWFYGIGSRIEDVVAPPFIGGEKRQGTSEIRKSLLGGRWPGRSRFNTVKGLDCLQHADVVIYDRLVDESILHEARPDAEKIYVGKASSVHTLEQEMINQLLIQKAREG